MQEVQREQPMSKGDHGHKVTVLTKSPRCLWASGLMSYLEVSLPCLTAL